MSDIRAAGLLGSNYIGPRRVVFIVNNDWWFLSHRATWGAALLAAGSEVFVMTEDTGKAGLLEDMGFKVIRTHIGREESTFGAIARSAVKILISLLRLNPDVVFLTAQAPYTLGWPAALLLRRTKFIRIVSGVGRALSPDMLGANASRVVRFSGRLSGHLGNVFTLFQVERDRETFSTLGMLPDPTRSLIIPGTGIEVADWSRDDARDFSHPVILFASRLFREKGIFEFVGAAEELRHCGWRFQIAGAPDTGVASAVTEHQLEEWRKSKAVEILGHCTNMRELLASATLLVLPTRHPEGTPRVLIEAGAAGLPTIVSGQPGCIAVVTHEESGLVLSAKPTVHELARAIYELGSNPERAYKLGQSARQHVSDRFSLDFVICSLLNWEPVGAVRK